MLLALPRDRARRKMAYVPDWESLAETVARVMACGYSVSEAQRDICHALRDGKLRQRYRVERVQTPNGFDVNLRAVGQLRSRFDQRDIIGRPRVPPDLIPDDIDWVNSRPKCPWLDQHRFLVRIDKIEVSTKDVIRTLCVGPSGVSSSGPSDLSSTRCLVPAFDGASLSSDSKDALWAKFCMGAPRRLRRSVERYSIVKRA